MSAALFFNQVPNLAVVVVMLSLAGLLLASPRRREAENLLLAAFLALIGLIFAVYTLFEVNVALHCGEGWCAEAFLWAKLDSLGSAFDPLLLLAFVTVHPYLRRTWLHRASMVWLAAAGVLYAAFVIPLRLEDVPAFREVLNPVRLIHVFAITAFGYAMCWVAAVAALRHAPTDSLARRARWACLAVGVAVVARLPFVLNEDFRIEEVVPLFESPWPLMVAMLAVVAAATLPAMLVLRGARQERDARRVVAAVAAVAVLLVLQAGVIQLLDIGFYHPLALRWIAFSCVVVYAVLAHQVLGFPAASRRVLPTVGAAILGIVAISIAFATLPEADLGTSPTVAIAAAVGLAASLPGFWATRLLLNRAERMPEGLAERRVALYSAAVESALAGGTEGGLARARRQLGLTRNEARVVEDLVRRSLRRPQAALKPGDEPLPGIVVERPLAGGSQARTFLARRVPEGTAVVVKQPLVQQPDARRRLWKELDALRGLRHPSIPRLLDFTLDPVLCIAYEHVPGRTLAAALRRGPLPEPVVAAMARDVLHALGALHGAGFAHGDVKPSNIILGPGGRAFLIDFGLVEGRAPLRATLAGDGRVHPQGTLEYMSPELAQTGRPGPAADLFALGLVVHEALTGRPLRTVRGLAVYQALERIERQPVRADQASPRWQAFFAACLAHDPQHRGSLPVALALLPHDSALRGISRKATAPPAPT